MPPKVNKIEQEIRKLSKLEGNKTCCNCTEKVPGYVDLTHNVFICTKCSGIHREFQFKIKGVSMSIFTEDDVAGLAAMGNEKFNSVYLSKLGGKEYAIANTTDTNKLKDFIRQKYVEKKWHQTAGTVTISPTSSVSSGFDGSAAAANSSAFESSQNPSEQKMKISLNRQPSAHSASRRASTGSGATMDFKKPIVSSLAGDLDLLNMGDSPQKQSATSSSFDPFSSSTNGSHNASNDKSNANDIFGASTHDPFASNTHDKTFDAFGGNSNSSGGFDAFSGSSVQQPTNSFSAFDNHPSNNNAQNNAHAFSATHNAPLPFIQTKPAPAPTPVSAPTTPASSAATAAPTKNFSAFDDLLSLSSTPAPNNSNNPFDNSPAAYGAAAQAHPQQQQHHQQQQQQYQQQPQQYPQHHPAQANPGYGYQQPPPGVNPYAPAPYNYPPAPGPAPGQYPHPGYPPQAYYGNPPPNNINPYAPQPYYNAAQAPQPRPAAPGQQQLAPAPANPPTPAQPDPFASMTTIAWGQVGANAPSASNPSNTTNNNNPPQQQYNPAPANTSNPYATPQHQQFNQTPATGPAQPQATSVNPFDLF